MQKMYKEVQPISQVGRKWADSVKALFEGVVIGGYYIICISLTTQRRGCIHMAVRITIGPFILSLKMSVC